MISLDELLRGVKVLQSTAKPGMKVAFLSYDSRQVQSGGLFVAVRGYETDGHHYLKQAADKGAAVAVVEDVSSVPSGLPYVQVENSRLSLAILAANFFDWPAAKMRLVGVTGTNGKTTVTYLLEALFKETGQTVGLLGTIANRVGGLELPAERTTPESLDLQRLLHLIAGNKAARTVMEVSSHALELSRVEGCEFDVGVFTNLSQDHLDFHTDMESYLKAKGKLFSDLGQGSKQCSKYAVLNADVPEFAYLKEITAVPVVSYGFSPKSDVRAENVKLGVEGSSFDICYPGGSLEVELKMTGKFSVYNVLAAFSVALKEGLSPEKIAATLADFQGVPGRFQLLNCGQQFAVVVDYAHTPDGLENVLQAARGFVAGRVIVVFGCGGNRDKVKRPLMGEVAARYSDYCVITSDNPRSEEPGAIINDILPGVQNHQTPFHVEPDRRRAIREALTVAKKGDLVMVAGKGHETYQEINGYKWPFDDRRVVTEVLQELGECDVNS